MLRFFTCSCPKIYYPSCSGNFIGGFMLFRWLPCILPGRIFHSSSRRHRLRPIFFQRTMRNQLPSPCGACSTKRIRCLLKSHVKPWSTRVTLHTSQKERHVFGTLKFQRSHLFQCSISDLKPPSGITPFSVQLKRWKCIPVSEIFSSQLQCQNQEVFRCIAMPTVFEHHDPYRKLQL